MFWNKKDSGDRLPDLPPLKTPLRMPFDISSRENEFDSDDANSELNKPLKNPSFPEFPEQKNFQQTAIREAVNEPITETSDFPQQAQSRMRTMEMDSPIIQPVEQKSFRLDSPPETEEYVPPKKPSNKISEVFVKVDKFNSAHKSIVAIRKKIDDIDSALKRIREIKMREEQELSAWEKEISSLKSKLQEINDSLFD